MPDDSTEYDFWATLVEEWEAYGIPCRIKPGFMCLNGYVQLPHDLLMDQAAVARVLTTHWGINYGPDNGGWIGFDTGHAGDYWASDDLVPYFSGERLAFANSMRNLARGASWGQRWTMDSLKQATEELAQQVAVAYDLQDTLRVAEEDDASAKSLHENNTSE